MTPIVFSCQKGTETERSINFTCRDIKEGAAFVRFGEKVYAAHRVRFTKLTTPDAEDEVIIHTIISKMEPGIEIEKETAIFLEDAAPLPTNLKAEDNIAYNCPYVCLKRLKAIPTENESDSIDFFPRVLVPFRGYEFIAEVIDEDNHIDESSGKDTFECLIAMGKTNETATGILIKTAINSSKYIGR